MSNLHDLAAPYLLGALDAAEQEAYVAHLESCRECQAEIGQLEEGFAAMVMADTVDPDPAMRSRILDALPAAESQPDAPNVTTTPETGRSRRWWASVLVPAVAVVALVVGLFAVLNRSPIDDIVAASDATTIQLDASEAYGQAPTEAEVVFSAERGAAGIQLIGLAPPAGDNVYQLWLIGADGPIPAGTFAPDADGVATVRVVGTAASGLVVGITEEPAGGSPAPTGDVLFSAEL